MGEFDGVRIEVLLGSGTLIGWGVWPALIVVSRVRFLIYWVDWVSGVIQWVIGPMWGGCSKRGGWSFELCVVHLYLVGVIFGCHGKGPGEV